MSIEQEDADYATALAVYRTALERLQKAKAPIAARERLKREAALERQRRADEMRMKIYHEEQEQKRFEYRVIHQRAREGATVDELTLQFAGKYQRGDIEYIISRNGEYM